MKLPSPHRVTSSADVGRNLFCKKYVKNETWGEGGERLVSAKMYIHIKGENRFENVIYRSTVTTRSVVTQEGSAAMFQIGSRTIGNWLPYILVKCRPWEMSCALLG